MVSAKQPSSEDEHIVIIFFCFYTEIFVVTISISFFEDVQYIVLPEWTAEASRSYFSTFFGHCCIVEYHIVIGYSVLVVTQVAY